MSDNWFQQGYGGIRGEEEALALKYGPRRFWMPVGSTKNIIFLDDKPACIHEHNPRMGGNWKNWFTCIRDVYQDDPSCCETLSGEYPRYYIGYYTVVNCSEWKDNRGNDRRFEIELYGAKLETLKLLRAKAEEDWGGSLTGKILKVRRTSDKSPAVGNDFTVEKKEIDLVKLWSHAAYKGKKIKDLFEKAKQDEDERHTLSKIFTFQKGADGAWLPSIPIFNYWDVLHPKTPGEIRTFLKAGKVDNPKTKGKDSSEDNRGGDGAADESVPF